MPIEGRWVDRIVGLENARTEIAMMRVLRILHSLTPVRGNQELHYRMIQ